MRKVFTIGIRSALPTRKMPCALRIYMQTLISVFLYTETLTSMRGLHEGEICFTSMEWKPSLNDCSKLKGQYTDVKSGSGISVGPSLKPHSLSLNKILVTPSLSHNVAVSQAVLRSRHHHFRAAP